MAKDIYTELIEIGMRLIQLGLKPNALPIAPNNNPYPYDYTNRCPKCGIDNQVMHYVCNHSECPGRVTCSS